MSTHNRRRTRAERNRDKIVAGMAKASRFGCLLCGGRAQSVGYWEPAPHLQAQFLAPPGKARLIAYSLCDGCQAGPDFMVRVEDKLIAQATPRTGSPELN